MFIMLRARNECFTFENQVVLRLLEGDIYNFFQSWAHLYTLSQVSRTVGGCWPGGEATTLCDCCVNLARLVQSDFHSTS